MDYEIRCTVDEALLSLMDAVQLADDLASAGLVRLVLQARRNEKGMAVSISPDFIGALTARIENVEVRCPLNY